MVVKALTEVRVDVGIMASEHESTVVMRWSQQQAGRYCVGGRAVSSHPKTTVLRQTE